MKISIRLYVLINIYQLKHTRLSSSMRGRICQVRCKQGSILNRKTRLVLTVDLFVFFYFSQTCTFNCTYSLSISEGGHTWPRKWVAHAYFFICNVQSIRDHKLMFCVCNSLCKNHANSVICDTIQNRLHIFYFCYYVVL